MPPAMELMITMHNKKASAILYDNPTSRAFAAQLPIVLDLIDYNNAEKISLLHRKLNTEHTPVGHTPSAGDITYYEPWGNLALFYKNCGYANGLISVGKIISGWKLLR